MRKLTTIVVAILVVLTLAAGEIGGYLWYNTKQQVDLDDRNGGPLPPSLWGVTVSGRNRLCRASAGRLTALINVR